MALSHKDKLPNSRIWVAESDNMGNPHFFLVTVMNLSWTLREKTDLISIPESWINKRKKTDTPAVVFSILLLGSHVKKFGSNFD